MIRYSRKVMSILLIAAIASSVTGCKKERKVKEIYAKSIVAEASMPEGTLYTSSENAWDRMSQNELDENFLHAIETFSTKSASQILYDTNENSMYSPISLYFALAVLSEGSEGKTAEELFQALGMESVDYETLSKEIDTMYKYLYHQTAKNTLKVSNAVWMNEELEFLPDYCDRVSKGYHSSLFQVDFSDKQTEKLMEDWVSNSVNGLIQPDIELEPEQAMIIMNTIYYTNQWGKEFFKDATQANDFYLTNGDCITCDFMNQTYTTTDYVQGDGYQICKIALQEGDSITICLPEEGVNIKDFVASPEAMKKAFEVNDGIDVDVEVSIPKFDYGCKMNLLDTLKKLGIEQAMAGNADFGRITDKFINLSGATQETHIKIDEEGIIAAAYTELTEKCSAAMPEEREKVVFKVNRPFLYQIQTSNGLVLFTGIVQNPTSK